MINEANQNDDTDGKGRSAAIAQAIKQNIFPFKIPRDIKPFNKYAYPKFDPGYVYRLLRDGKEAYEG